MSIPSRLRVSVQKDTLLVKALLGHPMENGFGKDADGQPVPAEFIQEIRLFLNEQLVTHCATGSGIAANPLFGWRLKGKSGDRIRLTWHDNLGRSGTLEALAS